MHRDVSLTRRWMDAMGVDIAVLFPSPMLQLGLHPQVEAEVALSRAYNRWLGERVLARGAARIRSMLYLPFNDPDASYRMVKEFAGKKGVGGFHGDVGALQAGAPQQLHEDLCADRGDRPAARVPRRLQLERTVDDMMNKFISVHALGFVWYNMVHMTNWVLNGMPERFPKLKVIWIESGLAWLPFMIQRLDNEYLMRSSECPA